VQMSDQLAVSIHSLEERPRTLAHHSTNASEEQSANARRA
jgi:hypothetical protein